MSSSGCRSMTSRLAIESSSARSPKIECGTGLNWMTICGAPLGQPLAGAQVERHAGPAPVVDVGAQRDEGLGVGRPAALVGVGRRPACPRPRPALYWPRTLQLLRRRARERPQRAQHLDLLVAHRVGVERRPAAPSPPGRAAAACGSAPCRAARRTRRSRRQRSPTPIGLGHGDLHVVDRQVVPERLEQGVGEAQRDQVLHRLLAEVVVDAEDRGPRRTPRAPRR